MIEVRLFRNRHAWRSRHGWRNGIDKLPRKKINRDGNFRRAPELKRKAALGAPFLENGFACDLRQKLANDAEAVAEN